MQLEGALAGRDVACSHGPAATGGWMKSLQALFVQAEMPDDPQGAEEGQGGMQPLPPGEGRSLLEATGRCCLSEVRFSV